MNQVISWLQNVVVRVVLTISLVGIAFVINAAISFDNSFQAQAEPLIPKTTTDQVNSYDSPFRENDQEKVNQLFTENKNPQTAPEPVGKLGEQLTKPQKTVKKNLESAADTARKKLDLDRPRDYAP
jgi:hypothetical protein